MKSAVQKVKIKQFQNALIEIKSEQKRTKEEKHARIEMKLHD